MVLSLIHNDDDNYNCWCVVCVRRLIVVDDKNGIFVYLLSLQWLLPQAICIYIHMHIVYNIAVLTKKTVSEQILHTITWIYVYQWIYQSVLSWAQTRVAVNFSIKFHCYFAFCFHLDRKFKRPTPKWVALDKSQFCRPCWNSQKHIKKHSCEMWSPIWMSMCQILNWHQFIHCICAQGMSLNCFYIIYVWSIDFIPIFNFIHSQISCINPLSSRFATDRTCP